jgi:hypothetical protein
MAMALSLLNATYRRVNMDTKFKTNYLLRTSRNFTQQQISIFNKLVNIGVKFLQNQEESEDYYKKWSYYTNQLDNKVKMAIIIRAGDEALEIFEEINK